MLQRGAMQEPIKSIIGTRGIDDQAQRKLTTVFGGSKVDGRLRQRLDMIYLNVVSSHTEPGWAEGVAAMHGLGVELFQPGGDVHQRLVLAFLGVLWQELPRVDEHDLLDAATILVDSHDIPVTPLPIIPS